MQKKILIVAAVAAVIIFLLKRKRAEIEGYAITYGTMGKQRNYYDKCVNDCFRNHSGDSGTGQMLMTCTDECQILANERIVAQIPDITMKQHQRHHEECDEKYDLETCYCMNDIKDFCRERICFQSKDQVRCMDSCIKVKGVDCLNDMMGGWRP